MSALAVVGEYVKSGKLVRMLAQARSLTLSQVYAEMGKILQEGLASYIPALAVMVEACKRIGTKCITELVALRERVVRELCELFGLDKLIQWVLGLLKKVPAWLLSLLQDVADVWQMLDHWSRGEFYLSELGAVLKNLASHWGKGIISAVNKAGKGIVKGIKAIGAGIVWLANENAAIQAYIFDRVDEVVDTFRDLGKDAVTGILRDIGLDPVADVVDTISDFLDDAEDTFVDTLKTAICFWC